MPGNCTFLLKDELTQLRQDETLKEHIKAYWPRYTAWAEAARSLQGGEVEFLTFDLVMTLKDQILKQETVTRIHAFAHQFGRDPEDLASLIARLCWEYPNLVENEKEALGLQSL